MSKKLTANQDHFCDMYLHGDGFTTAKVFSKFEHPLSYGDLYYVYLLINPITDEIFYVGKGKGKRAESHLRENITGKLINARKHIVINEILDKGEEPRIIVFANNLEEKDAFSIERILIKRFKKLITNASSGQYDKHEKNQQWAIATLRKIKPFEKWVNERPRPQKHIEIYHEMLDTISKVASGEKKLYDTIKITTRNGFNCVEID
tara:strand:- start:17172 stop:17789 length:618 start_codon:yes stop_codon:yes gene_type:complete